VGDVFFMKKLFKSRKHILKMGLVAAVSAIWLVIRTGGKPSRITYPCQKAATANVHVFLLVILAPLVSYGKLDTALPHALNHRGAKTVLLVGSLLLAFGSVTFTVNNSMLRSDYLPISLTLAPQTALTTSNVSDLFFIQYASGVEGDLDNAVSTLLRMMGDHGLYFYNTTDQPIGLIGKNDVVLIKVNCQWPQRGGTNTDLVKSLIKKIVNHPEGFTGEIVVADNGQGSGNLNRGESNAYNHSQSMQAVVDSFSSYKVSTWLWDSIRTNAVNEYDQGSFNDGYVLNYTPTPPANIYVSYPKFKTRYDTYISFKKGIWSNATSSYDLKRLKVINVPVLKSHSVFGVTACVKHYMGVVSEYLTGTHSMIGFGAMGTEIVETRFPTLNILDAIWVNANPKEGGGGCGPATNYAGASFTDIICASLDPVALEYWASKHILIPAAIQKNYTKYSSLDPDYAPLTPGLTASYNTYLNRSITELKKAGCQVTMNETEMNVYLATPSSVVHNLNTGLDYATIQEAIDANETLDGHTLLADEGTYLEHVVITKSLSLVGASRENTVIDGSGVGGVVEVLSNSVNISNFRIQNAGNSSMRDCGLWTNNSANCVFSNITIQNCYNGMVLWESSNGSLANNAISNTGLAILIHNSNSTVLTGNEAIDCYYGGIGLISSTNCLMEGNYMINCSSAFVAGGDMLEHFLNSIDTSNTIDGKPIYYLINQTNLNINPSTFPDIGSLTVINSTNVNVENLTLTRSGQCVEFAFTSNSTMKNVVASKSNIGIGLHSATNNMIIGNNVSDCFFSISLSSSHNNTLRDNIILNSALAAITFRNSSRNLIAANNASNDYRCIDLIDSENNTIYHNNFVDYSENYVDDHPNTWDNGFEGNYWSKYNGTDSNKDGIGDTPYTIDHLYQENKDNYPLMGTFHSYTVWIPATFTVTLVSNSTISSLDVGIWLEFPENRMIIFSVSGEDGWFGFCRICIPHALISEPYNVSIDGAQPRYVDYNVYDNDTHRWLYFTYQHSTHLVVIVPEFPPLTILPLLMVATLLAVTTYRRKHTDSKRRID
jgi:parallel beta-helix repeat protein